EGAPVLEMVTRHIACQRVEVLQDARATDPTPRVRRGMGTAAIFGGALDGFGRRIGAHPPRIIERHPQIITQRRLTRILSVDQRPLTHQIRRCLVPANAALAPRRSSERHAECDRECAKQRSTHELARLTARSTRAKRCMSHDPPRSYHSICLREKPRLWQFITPTP